MPETWLLTMTCPIRNLRSDHSVRLLSLEPLFSIHTALTMLLYFKGNPATLAISYPTWALWWSLFLCSNLLYLLKGQLLGLVPGLGLPDCQGDRT